MPLDRMTVGRMIDLYHSCRTISGQKMEFLLVLQQRSRSILSLSTDGKRIASDESSISLNVESSASRYISVNLCGLLTRKYEKKRR